MFKILVLILILFSTQAFSNDQLIQNFISKNCKGEKTICEDDFIFKIEFKKNTKNEIIILNSNILDHKHIVKISEFNFKKINNIFLINFYIINNLEKKFDFEINGEISKKSYLPKKIIISFQNQFLAEYSLEKIDSIK